MTKPRGSTRAECLQCQAWTGPFGASPALAITPETAASCPRPSSTTSAPSRREDPAGIGGDRAIGGKAVRAAIEREVRIVMSHLASADERYRRSRYRADLKRQDRRNRAAPPNNRSARTPRALRVADRWHWRARLSARRRCDRFRCRTRSVTRAVMRAGSRPIRCRDRRSAAHRFGGRRRHRARLRRRFRFPDAAPVCPAKAGTAGSRIPGDRECAPWARD